MTGTVLLTREVSTKCRRVVRRSTSRLAGRMSDCLTIRSGPLITKGHIGHISLLSLPALSSSSRALPPPPNTSSSSPETLPYGTSSDRSSLNPTHTPSRCSSVPSPPSKLRTTPSTSSHRRRPNDEAVYHSTRRICRGCDRCLRGCPDSEACGRRG